MRIGDRVTVTRTSTDGRTHTWTGTVTELIHARPGDRCGGIRLTGADPYGQRAHLHIAGPATGLRCARGTWTVAPACRRRPRHRRPGVLTVALAAAAALLLR